MEKRSPMAILTLPKGSKALVTKDFTASEFDCPCDKCGSTLIDLELVAGIQRMRDALRVPITVTSGYRCTLHQIELQERGLETAKKKSTHEEGRAADISTGKHSGDQLEACARGCGFRAVGVGKMFIHIDMRDDKDRRWTYLKR